MKRVLYLDGVPPETRLQNPIVVSRVKELDEIYMLMFRRQPVPVTLDIRSLQKRHSGRLLKFIEEYRGDIVLIANDPVYPAILSRFNEHVKTTRLQKTTFLELKLQNCRGHLSEKVKQLLGASDGSVG